MQRPPVTQLAMALAPRSVALWRSGVVLFAALALTQTAIEVFHAPNVLQLGRLAAPLYEGHTLRERGPTTFVVDRLPEDSPLRALGVVPGDRLRYDHPMGRWVNHVAGDRVPLTVLHGADERAIDVTVPAAPRLPRLQVANYVTDMAGTLAALLIGIVIGLRRPDRAALRGIVASGLFVGCVFPFSAPASAHIGWLDFVSSVASELAGAALVLFALNYPDDRPSGWRARLRRIYPWIFGVIIAAALVFYARLYAGYYEPVPALILRTSPIVLPAIFFWAIILAWREARGEWRTRLQWVLATLGTIMVVVMINNVNALLQFPLRREDVALALNVAVVAAEGAMVYAILRRRIFDFGFAVNRTLVFAIVGAILLGVFQIAHGLVAEFLHFDDKVKALLLSAVLSVAVYLSFTQLKMRVEKVVDRVFFSAWAAKEEDLRRFVAESKHASDADALSRLAVAAVDRFTTGAGCALYRRRLDDAYVLSDATLASVPLRVSANDEAVLALLAHSKAHALRDPSPLHAALALPMSHRGELFGFILAGARPDGEPYRPDQVQVLEFATHEIGLDFHALELASLAAEIASERRTSETLRAQLSTAMTLAKANLLEGSS
jgi:hypothetical protein